MAAGAAVSAAGMATQRDANGNNMLNVFGRGATAGQSKSNKAKVSFAMDTMFGGGLGLFQQYDDEEGIELPAFFQDPYYTEVQDYLNSFSKDMLAGILPDYYKQIGETGGKEFEDMLSMINRDTSKSVNESLVRRGISRSGVGLSTMAKANADTNTKLRWEDYARALTGKQYLLGKGLDVQEGIRTAGLNNQSQVNQFNLAEAGIGINAQQIMDQRGQQEDNMWGQLLQSAIGAVGSYMGTQGGGTTNTGTSNIAGSGYNMNSIDLSGLTGFQGSTAPATYGSAAYYQNPNWNYGGYSF